MAIRLYDEALLNKIKFWCKDPNISVLGPSDTARLFQLTGDKQFDKPITLPLIGLSRTSSFEILNTNKTDLSSAGKKLIWGKGTRAAQMLHAVPITIHYQLDIFTRTYEEGDEYLRNFIFNFINNPKLIINIPYNDADIEHIASVKLVSTVNDNSDITERLFPTQFTRWTLQLQIEDAYIWSSPIQKYVRLESELDIRNGVKVDEEGRKVPMDSPEWVDYTKEDKKIKATTLEGKKEDVKE